MSSFVRLFVIIRSNIFTAKVISDEDFKFVLSPFR